MNLAFPVVEGFTIVRSVGHGGFAEVFLAEQSSLNREVALKVLDVRLGDEEAQRRFRNECRTVGSLSWHPHVVTVFEAGVTSTHRPYLAMEYLPAGSFEERLADGPMPVADVLSVGVQIADALAAAHASGVLHRDVKPANVLIDRFGEGRLADFGIARFGGGTRTATGVISATVSYAAPEILSGRPATEASDLYGLGATLHALLRGRAPFVNPSGDDALVAVIARVAIEPPPPLEPLGTPPALADLVGRLLAKDPADRPASAAEVVTALHDVERQLGTGVTRSRAVPPPVATPELVTSPAPVIPPPPPPGPAPAGSSPPPPEPAWVPPPPPPGPIRPPGGRRPSALARVLAISAVVLALGAGLAYVLAQGDDDQSGSSDGTDTTRASSATPTTPTSAPPPRATTGTAPPATAAAEAVWTDATPPTAPEQQLLDQLPDMFSAATRCTAINDADEPYDRYDIYPTDRDVASIECAYGDQSTIVYSLFDSDQTMGEFFDGRLRGRDISTDQGDIGPSPPWQKNYTDDPERGTGRIYGNLRTSPQIRSEVGWIRYGTQTYAYSYRLDEDFAAYFDYWSGVFGGPAA
jgi:serine/threonine protein kinase